MGIMDFLSGRDVRSFTKGYIGAEVDKMEAKTAKTKFEDELKATELSEINISNEKAKNAAKILSDKEEADEKERLTRLLAMGYTEEYIRTQMPSALLDDNLLVQLDLANQVRWGNNKNWKTIKLIDGPDWAIGMTPMDYELALFKKSKNKNNIKSTIKETNNISDNVSNVVLEDSETLSKTTKEEVPYTWTTSELLYGKKKAAVKQGNSWISPDGLTIINGWQNETTAGSGVYNPEYVTVEDKDGEPKRILASNLVNLGWIDSTTQEGIERWQRANPSVSGTKVGESYMIQFTDTDRFFSVDTITKEYTGGKLPETIVTGIDAAGIKKLGLKSDMTFPVLAETVGGGIDFVPFNVNINELKELGRKQNFNVLKFDQGKYLESMEVPVISAPERIKAGSTNMSRIEKSGLELVFGKGSFDFREGMGESGERIWEFNILGNDPHLESATTGYRFVLSDAYTILKAQSAKIDGKGSVIGKLPESMVTLLGLSSNNPIYVDAEQIKDGTAKLFRNVRNDLVASYKERIASGEDFTQDKEDFGITSIQPDIVAQQLADAEMGTIENLGALILGHSRIEAGKETTETKLRLNREQTIQEYFPKGPFGAQEFEQFIIDNITQEDINSNTFPDLKTAIDQYADPGTTDNKILKSEAVKIIEEIKEGEGLITMEGIQKKEPVTQEEIDKSLEELKIKHLFNTPFPPSSAVLKAGAGKERIEKFNTWMTTHKEDWNKLIDHIYTLKPEVEQKEITKVARSGGLDKKKTITVDTLEFKNWKKKYKKYLDIGKK